MTWDQVGDLDPNTPHAKSAGASDPHARLADMDAMGVDQAFLYPTLVCRGLSSDRGPGCGGRTGPGL